MDLRGDISIGFNNQIKLGEASLYKQNLAHGVMVVPQNSIYLDEETCYMKPPIGSAKKTIVSSMSKQPNDGATWLWEPCSTLFIEFVWLNVSKSTSILLIFSVKHKLHRSASWLRSDQHWRMTLVDRKADPNRSPPGLTEGGLASGNWTWRTWPIEIVDLPMKNGGSFKFANCKRLPEGSLLLEIPMI